jgi:hypothetical protein
VFVGSLSLFATKVCVGESLGSFLLYLFLYALIPYTSQKCLYFVHLNTVVQKLDACCPRECSWSLGPVGTIGQV